MPTVVARIGNHVSRSPDSLSMAMPKPAIDAKAADIAPGATFDVVLTLTIKKGWHAYANPTGVEGVPPTRIVLDPGQGAVLVAVEYPRGVAKVLASSGSEKVALYEGQTTLKARVKLDPDSKPGTGTPTLRLTVHYQACNDRACLAPARVGVTVPLAAQ